MTIPFKKYVDILSGVGGTPGGGSADSDYPSDKRPPGPPIIGTATAGAGNASVYFTRPLDDGGSPIIGYRAYLSTGQMQVGGASPIDFQGLPGGVAVTAMVQALNAVGYGPFSNASNSVTPSGGVATVPPAPTIGTAVAGNGQVLVYFTPAGDGGSVILDFTALLSTGQTATGATSPIAVTAPNGTPVTAQVRARNAIGNGPYSTASNTVTPSAPVSTNRFISESGTDTFISETGDYFIQEA